jgi:hypothetical protein
VFIPLILTQVRKLDAWNRRRVILEELKRRPATLEDLGLTLAQLEADMRKADAAALAATPSRIDAPSASRRAVALPLAPQANGTQRVAAGGHRAARH